MIEMPEVSEITAIDLFFVQEEALGFALPDQIEVRYINPVTKQWQQASIISTIKSFLQERSTLQLAKFSASTLLITFTNHPGQYIAVKEIEAFPKKMKKVTRFANTFTLEANESKRIMAHVCFQLASPCREKRHGLTIPL